MHIRPYGTGNEFSYALIQPCSVHLLQPNLTGERAEPSADLQVVRTLEERERLAPVNGEPRGNGPDLAVAGRVVIFIHVAEIPINPLSVVHNTIQANRFAGPTPLCRKVNDDEKRRRPTIQRRLQMRLGQGDHHRFLHLLVVWRGQWDYSPGGGHSDRPAKM